MKITVLTIISPETQKTTAVNVAASEAAFGTFFNEPTLRLSQYSRSPERQDCGQGLRQIEADPENCRIWNIVAKWYEGKKCAFCRKPIDPLSHVDPRSGFTRARFQNPGMTRNQSRAIAGNLLKVSTGLLELPRGRDVSPDSCRTRGGATGKAKRVR